MPYEIPKINRKFCVIVDRDEQCLAALISSYLSRKDVYLPIFEFPGVRSKNEIDNDVVDENYITKTRANVFITFTINAINRIHGCEYLILAGLSNEQKSFLDFLSDFNIIEIPSIAEVDFYLFPFVENESKKLMCKSADILLGLFLAQKSNQILELSEDADRLLNINSSSAGIVVVENDTTVSSVVAINYAHSINASIEIVPGLNDGEQNNVRDLIRDWQGGFASAYDELLKKINGRIGHINFKNFSFATFFTEGLPYTLATKNVIPSTYVHLFFRADFFIINNLFFENSEKNGSAIVFSPQNFSDEETSEVVNILESNNYFVRKLIGENASVENIGKCLQYYPYDIFHICSHGGEIDGYEIIEEFTDRDGNKHTIEYDEVVGFAPSYKTGFVSVHRKTIFRKFDGLVWKSPELKAQNYPHYIFVDMQTKMSTNFVSTNQTRKHKEVIPTSCAIKCYFSNYQAMFSILADHSSPFIFNNTCWSANEISESFLVSGVRGYICTLWAVENKIASEVAKSFYKKLFSKTILDAFFNAINSTKNSSSDNIYIFYGLHFATLKSQNDKTRGRMNVYKSFIKEYNSWQKILKARKGKRNEEVIQGIINWLQTEILSQFH